MKTAVKGAEFTSSGELKIVGENSKFEIRNSKDNSLIDKVGAFAEVAVAKVRAGLIEAQKLVVDGVDVGKKLMELSNKVEKQEKTIEDLQKQIDGLKK